MVNVAVEMEAAISISSGAVWSFVIQRTSQQVALPALPLASS